MIFSRTPPKARLRAKASFFWRRKGQFSPFYVLVTPFLRPFYALSTISARNPLRHFYAPFTPLLRNFTLFFGFAGAWTREEGGLGFPSSGKYSYPILYNPIVSHLIRIVSASLRFLFASSSSSSSLLLLRRLLFFALLLRFFFAYSPLLFFASYFSLIRYLLLAS